MKQEAKHKWEGWSVKKKYHFIYDHKDKFKEVKMKASELVDLDYKDLPEAVKAAIEEHLSMPAYKSGGGVDKAKKVFFKVVYRTKEQASKRGKLKGSMSAMVFATSRENAIEVAKKENEDFFELASCKPDKKYTELSKMENGGNISNSYLDEWFKSLDGDMQEVFTDTEDVVSAIKKWENFDYKSKEQAYNSRHDFFSSPSIDEENEYRQGGNITTSYLKDFIKRVNKESNAKFSLEGAYGKTELWVKDKDGKEHRIESGSKKDCYEALIKNRYNEKYTGVKETFEEGGGVEKPYVVYSDSNKDGKVIISEHKNKEAAKKELNKLWETDKYESLGIEPKETMALGGGLKKMIFEKGNMIGATASKDGTFSVAKTIKENGKFKEIVIAEDFSVKDFETMFGVKGYEKREDRTIVGFYYSKPNGDTVRLVPSFYKQGEEVVARFEDGGDIEKNKTVFFKIASHRAREKFNRVNIPYVSLYSFSWAHSAATGINMCYEKDFEKVKSIKGVTLLKSLPKHDFLSRNENAKLKNIFELKYGSKMEDGGNLNSKLRSVRVTFEDGNVINTNMTAHLTDEEIRKYYAVGKSFNMGSGENDKMVKVKSVEILDNKKPMNELELTEDEGQFICDCINRYGTGEHPQAELKTLGSFTKSYIKDCVMAAKKEALSEHGATMLESCKGKLGC